jgi:hypothetical protein
LHYRCQSFNFAKSKINLSEMNNLNKSRELLKKYFRETPKEVLNEKLEKFNQAPIDGPSVAQYLSMFASHYTFFDNTIPSKKFNNITVQTKWTELVFSNEKNEKIISNLSSTLIKTDSRAEFDNYNFFALAA